MSNLQAILEYQEIDKKMFLLEKEISESEERKKYVKLQKFLKVAPERLDALDAKAASLKAEADSLASKAEKVEAMLGDFENLEELVHGGADIAFYKKKAQSIVSSLKQIRAEINTLSATIKETDAEYQKLKKQVIAAQKQYAEASEEYKAVKGAKESERKQIETQLVKAAEAVKVSNTKILEWYLTKRKEKMFPIVGVLNHGRCPFCGMEPPIAMKSRLADGIECDNCHKIIFSQE
jgi:predicted  nucleic acid-binding Zn-ribbon protein